MSNTVTSPDFPVSKRSQVIGFGVVGAGLTLFSAMSIFVCWLTWTDIAGRPLAQLDGNAVASMILPLPFACTTSILWGAIFRKCRFVETGGKPLRDDGTVARLGTSMLDPLWAAIVGVLVASFPFFFVVVSLRNRISLTIAILVVFIVVAAGMVAAAYSVRRVLSGAGDVVLNRGREVLTLPAGNDRDRPRTVAWSSIADVKVEECNRPTDWRHGATFRGMTIGGTGKPVYHATVIVIPDERGVVSEERVVGMMFEPEANRLADWLCRQLGRQWAPGCR